VAFYDLPKAERTALVVTIQKHIADEVVMGMYEKSLAYFADKDTYIRKSAYLSVGELYATHTDQQPAVLRMLNTFFADPDFKLRQTVINAAGEIGKKDFDTVRHFFDKGLLDSHHSPRNAVIGSIKKMGEVNPRPILSWAKQYLHHENKEIRREICHGIELRGRKHPEDILPLLQELQHDRAARVRNTLVHVLGQIAYKKGCLLKVLLHLKDWENHQLVQDALKEIIDVHNRYRNFAALTQHEAIRVIDECFPNRELRIT
jgi:HEAT repeat protein